MLLAARSPDGELKDVAGFEVQLALQIPRADRRSLGVHENRCHGTEVRRDLADFFDDLADPLVRAVAHVEAENICSRQDHFLQNLRRIRCRPQCADDLRLAHPSKNDGWRENARLKRPERIEVATRDFSG